MVWQGRRGNPPPYADSSEIYFYFIVTESVMVCCREPEVAMMVTGVVDLESVVAFVMNDPPAQPFMSDTPAMLTRSSRRTCKRRRFLNPKKQSATASAEPGKSGFLLLLEALVPDVFAVIPMEHIVEADEPEGVMVDGAKLHDVPEGSPMQLKETAELNPFCGRTEREVEPL